jgi:hypothetical protein
LWIGCRVGVRTKAIAGRVDVDAELAVAFLDGELFLGGICAEIAKVEPGVAFAQSSR